MLLLVLGLMACGPKKAPVVDLLAERPPVGPPPAFQPPAAESFQLENGLTVWVLSRPDLPLVSLRLSLPGGSAADPAEHPGLTYLADEMLVHGAGDRDAAQYAEALERQAIDLWVGTDSTRTTFHLDCHADRFAEGLALMTDALLAPRFDAEELDRVRAQQEGDILGQLDDGRAVASMVAWQQWFGAGHPLAHPTEGTVSGIAGLGPDALRASWTGRAVPSRSTLVVTGAVDAASLKDTLASQFSDWVDPAEPTPVALPAAQRVGGSGPAYFLVDKPEASQSVLRVLLPGWTADQPEAVPGSLAVVVLGGTFTSRLNRLLREEKGYTYGAGARSLDAPGFGVIVASTNVQRDVTGPALVDLLAELKKLPAGITDDELRKAQGARRTEMVEAMSTRSSLADSLLNLVERRLPPDGLQRELEALSAATSATVGATLARPTLDRAIVVVSGDLSKIQAPLSAAVPGPWTVVQPPR